MNTPETVDTNAGSAPPVRQAWWRQPVVLVAAVAALLLALQWYDNHRQMKRLQTELARQADAGNRENRGAADAAREPPAPLAAPEPSPEAPSARPAADVLQQDLVRSRDEAMLSEIEQILLTAHQQLVITGNARAAVPALQAIEARLARAERAQFGGLRRALARDLERLRLAPQLDLAATAARLDEIAGGIERLPLLLDVRPSTEPAVRKAPAADTNPWLRFAREFWQDVRDLVRIERIDNTEAAPLNASQAYFLRENLRLRLLGARLALLASNEKSYKADLKAAREWLARYFDVRTEAVAGALASLRQLDGASVGERPELTPSLDAVRSVRATLERR
jgi:uroporphyrin-3 C-methyltransferase